MAYEIEDVPVKVSRVGAASKYPLADLKVGQSILVPYNKPVKDAETGVVQSKEEAQVAQLAALRGVAQQGQAKFAEKTGGKRVNRKGAEVDETRNVRTFGVAHDVDANEKQTGKGFRLGRTA